ncbi:MAG: ABC transporter permease, partial [Pyrinomonadaceae bacterium]|nr:ABC transporter permease [Pyrinomonadaceae bacterium]
MATIWQDIKYGARMLLKNPGFTLVAVFALALGIGANTAIFSVVNTVLLNPLPFENSDRIVMVYGALQGGGDRNNGSFPDFADFKSQAQSFDHIAAYSQSGATLANGDDIELLQGAIVSADLFPLLGVSPTMGRTFSAEEDSPQGASVVVISHGLWQRRFGGEQGIVGQGITLNSRNYTVVGVMPRAFKFPVQAEKSDFWMPIEADPTVVLRRKDRGGRFLKIVARIKPTTTLAQAHAEINTIARRIGEQYPDTSAGVGVNLLPLYEDVVGDVRTALLVLLSAVGFVLLIACANVANLLLARAAARGKEIAVRTALGASRARLIRQLLTESLLLAFIGGTLGSLLALWGVDLLVAASPSDIPRVKEIALDARVLGFTFLISILTGIFFGLIPALGVSKFNLNEVLKEGGRGSTEGAHRNRVRSLLVVTEIALSLVLLIGAGLLIKSFLHLRDTDPGFDPQPVLVTSLSVPRAKYPESEQQKRFFQQVLERVKEVPGVETVGGVDFLPLAGSTRQSTFSIAGRAPRVPGQEPDAIYHAISPDYFRAMSIPIQKGRAFTERDAADSSPVIIINETFARRHFPGEDPVGKQVTIDNADPKLQVAREIVGVVKDVRHLGLDAAVEPEFYVNYLQAPDRRMTLVMRAASTNPASIAGIAAATREGIKAIDKDQYVPNIRTMEEVLSASIAPRRFSMMLLGTFAFVAL